jgi:hypothetical protein
MKHLAGGNHMENKFFLRTLKFEMSLPHGLGCALAEGRRTLNQPFESYVYLHKLHLLSSLIFSMYKFTMKDLSIFS